MKTAFDIAAEKFIKLTERAQKIVASDASWETKYDSVFEWIAPEIRTLGFRFDYYDPDTTYEADVTAYVNALTEKADELRKML